MSDAPVPVTGQPPPINAVSSPPQGTDWTVVISLLLVVSLTAFLFWIIRRNAKGFSLGWRGFGARATSAETAITDPQRVGKIDIDEKDGGSIAIEGARDVGEIKIGRSSEKK